MRFLRYIVIGVNAFAALAVLAIGAGAWLLSSEAGSAWLVKFAAGRVAALSIGSSSGTLAGELRLGQIELRLDNDDVDIAEFRFELNLGQLLARAVVLDGVRLGAVRVTHRNGGEAQSGEALDLPVAIVVRDAQLASLQLVIGDDERRFERTQFSGTLIGSILEIEHLETAIEGVDVSGSGQIELAEALSLDLDFVWAGEFGAESWAGRGAARGRLPQLAVEHELSLPFRMSASGSVDLDAGPGIDVEASWTTDLAWPGFELAASPSGRVELSGRPDSLQYSGEGELRLRDLSFAFTANGTLAGTDVLVDALTLNNDGAALTAAGSFAIDTLEWDLAVDGRDLDPSLFLVDWPGRLAASGNVRGGIEPELRLEFEGFEIEGRLRGYPVTASAAASYTAPGVWRFEQVELFSGEDLVTLSGTLAETMDLRLQAQMAQPGLLLPGLSGRLQADLRVAGPLAAPSARGEIDATALHYRGFLIAVLSAMGGVDLYAGGIVDVDIQGSGIQASNLNADTLTASAKGTLQQHELSFALTAPDWRMALAGSGALDAAIWQGEVDSWVVDQAALGEWRLRAPADLQFGASVVELSEICIARDNAELCAALTWNGTASEQLAIEARAFDLQMLTPFLPEALTAQGVYDLNAQFTELSRDPQGSITIDGGPTQLRYAASNTEVMTTYIDSVAVSATLTGRSLALQLALDGRDTGRVSLDATLDDIRDRDSAVAGELDVLWSDLEVLSLLSPDVGAVSGAVGVVLEFAGSVNEPQVQGRAEWNGGTIDLPVWGVAVDRIEALATSVDGSRLEFDASGWVEDAELTLRGAALLDASQGWPTQLTLTGESVPIVQLPDAEVYVSPDLDIDIELPKISVAGTVLVPRARLALDELPEQAVRPSSDAVVHGIEQAEAARPLNVTADIRMVLGDDVSYTGSNLNTTLGGDIRVQYTSGRSADASGSLTIAGSYDAYGQSLALDRGELIFTGPLDDPGLDVRAVRTVGSTTVGVQLSGTLKAPETRMFSDPAMSEADALAYLLLGRPLAGSGDEESATVQSAALSMGLQQALPVVQRIGETLGFDEFAIGTDDVAPGALMAGKYLSPKVYIRYSYGLFNRIGGLLLRFRINDYLSIETRSGEQKSMDVLYTIEKN